jgi:hypothetical protein
MQGLITQIEAFEIDIFIEEEEEEVLINSNINNGTILPTASCLLPTLKMWEN